MQCARLRKYTPRAHTQNDRSLKYIFFPLLSFISFPLKHCADTRAESSTPMLRDSKRSRLFSYASRPPRSAAGRSLVLCAHTVQVFAYLPDGFASVTINYAKHEQRPETAISINRPQSSNYKRRKNARGTHSSRSELLYSFATHKRSTIS